LGERRSGTLIGGPTVLIEIGGFRLLTDPTFDAPRTFERPGAATLVKTRGPALPAESLKRIDAVLLSHDQHADNLDDSGRALLPRAGAVFTTRIGASRLGGATRGLAPWETVTLEGPEGARLLVTATPARHGPPGVEPLTGEVIGFAIGLAKPGDSIYVSGDTVWYDGVAEVARRFSPRLVLLFAGAARTRGAIHLTMDSNDAIEAAHAFAGARIVPVHTDGWAHFSENGDALAAAFATLGFADRLTRLESGRPTEIALA
jgi:L-ascorbate metabolism protein UlaG (beta-lactamase superfamily)